MNPILQMLQQLMGQQGGQFGIPSSFQPALAGMFSQYQDFQSKEDASKQSNLNTDPKKDIDPYRVNAFKGYIAQMGGMVPGGMPGMMPPGGTAGMAPGMMEVAPFAPFLMPGSQLTPYGQQMQKGGFIGQRVNERFQKALGLSQMQAGGFANPFDTVPRQQTSYNRSFETTDYNMNSKGFARADDASPIKYSGDGLDVINDILSIPQNLLTFAATGKYQDPSEALDISNPALAVIADIGLDPLTYISMGGMAGLKAAAKASGGVKSLNKVKKLEAMIKTIPVAGEVREEVNKQQQGGFINNTGYTPGTPSFNNPFNVIPSNNITMKDTPFPVMAIPNNGQPQILQPGMNAKFNGANSVLEMPLMQMGGFTQQYDPNQLMAMLGLGQLQPEQFDRGGRIAKRKARLEKKLETATAKGNDGQVRRLTGRLDDIAAGGSGLTRFGSEMAGWANNIGDGMKQAGSIISLVPGVGTAAGMALGALGSGIGGAIQTDQELGVGTRQNGWTPLPQPTAGVVPPEGTPPVAPAPTAGGYMPNQGTSLFNMINQNRPTNMGFGQQPPPLGTVAQNIPNPGTNYSIPGLSNMFQGAVPGPTGGIAGGINPGAGQGGAGGGFDIMSMLTQLAPLLQSFGQGQVPTGKYGGLAGLLKKDMHEGRPKKKAKKYQLGGEVMEEMDMMDQLTMIPVQTEKVGGQPEMIVHLDNTITPVNAKKKHSQMDDDEITDIIPEGSYISSADKKMILRWKDADEIVLAVKTQPYEEKKQGKLPEEIKLSSLWPKGSKRDMTFAELMEIVAIKYPTVDREDIFTKLTNQSNLDSRLPYITNLIRLNEEAKSFGLKQPIMQYKKGGYVKKPKKYQDGNWVEGAAGLVTSLTPLLGSLFGGGGGGQQQGTAQGIGQMNPLYQNALMATIPAYQTGVNMNIGAQSNALNQGISDFSALGNQLIADAQQSATGQNFANLGATGLAAMNALGKETQLGRLDLGASRSRINNFRPMSASRAAVDAAATPTYDSRAILQELGGNRGGSVLAQLESQRMGARNQAAGQRNQALDQWGQSQISQLNQIDATEQPFNLNQQEKEMMLRDQRRSGLTGSLSQGMQRGADINTGLLSQMGNIQQQILPITTQFALQNAGLAGQDMMLGSQNAFNGWSALASMDSQNQLAQYLQQNQPQNAPPIQNPVVPPLNNSGTCPAGQIKSCGVCVSQQTAEPNGCLSNQVWEPNTGTCVCQ